MTIISLTIILPCRIIFFIIKLLYRIFKKMITSSSEVVKESAKPFYVRKFVATMWRNLHPHDKEVLRRDSVAMANFRLGVIASLQTIGLDRQNLEDVVNRIESNNFR